MNSLALALAAANRIAPPTIPAAVEEARARLALDPSDEAAATHLARTEARYNIQPPAPIQPSPGWTYTPDPSGLVEHQRAEQRAQVIPPRVFLYAPRSGSRIFAFVPGEVLRLERSARAQGSEWLCARRPAGGLAQITLEAACPGFYFRAHIKAALEEVAADADLPMCCYDHNGAVTIFCQFADWPELQRRLMCAAHLWTDSRAQSAFLSQI